MTEEQDLLAKISQLAGQINQHKNQRAHPQHASSSASYHSRHPRAGWTPYGTRGAQRRPAAHRNRTLILNSGSGGTGTSRESSQTPGGASESNENTAAPNGWVAKRDRHMQLINSAIYDKEAQARTRAIAATLKEKREKRGRAEAAKVLRYAQGTRNTPAATSASGSVPKASSYQIFVHDIPFVVAKGGSKLIRQSSATLSSCTTDGAGLRGLDDQKDANKTPKRATVGGVTFVRSKNGNLHRLGAVVEKRYCFGSAIYRGSTTQLASRKPGKIKKRDELCKRFSRTGTCYKGPTCPYIHDPNKVAICKEFLQTGKCHAGESCDLSHEPSPHRSPVCVHFIRGRCSNPECRYSHVRVTPGAPVCRAFGILGYCEKGEQCTDRHVYECPDYANTGSCKKSKCTLPHVDRAGQIRKAAAVNKAEKTAASDDDNNDNRDDDDDDGDDVSSDEEDHEEIDSDDVDSDELDSDDEPVEMVEGGQGGLSGQQDFVHI